MIEFHCHILPGIDDGSKSRDMSVEMIREEINQGVSHIVATPHFYANQDSVERFLDRRSASFEKLHNRLIEEQINIPMSIGAEVYYFGGIGKAEMVQKLCYTDTNILLLEMPFVQWQCQMYHDIKTLVEKQKLTLIMAHVERYIEFQKDKSVWEAIFDLPVYPQINTGDFLTWKKRGKCLKLIKEGYDVLLGSDCHNMSSRMPNMAAGREVIAKKLGADTLAAIDSRGERLLVDSKK